MVLTPCYPCFLFEMVATHLHRHLYHLLAPGDNVTAVTFRKVQKENETGLASTNKVKVERCALAYGKRIRSLRG